MFTFWSESEECTFFLLWCLLQQFKGELRIPFGVPRPFLEWGVGVSKKLVRTGSGPDPPNSVRAKPGPHILKKQIRVSEFKTRILPGTVRVQQQKPRTQTRTRFPNKLKKKNKTIYPNPNRKTLKSENP